MIGGFHEAVVYFRAEVRILVTHLVTLFKARSWDTKKSSLNQGLIYKHLKIAELTKNPADLAPHNVAGT